MTPVFHIPLCSLILLLIHTTPLPTYLSLAYVFLFRSSSHIHLSIFLFTLHLTKSCNNGVTCARIYCYVFIYVRMRLLKPRVKWKGYHVQEKYQTLLLLFEVISHIRLCSWMGEWSRGRDENKIASEGGGVDLAGPDTRQLANILQIILEKNCMLQPMLVVWRALNQMQVPFQVRVYVCPFMFCI